MKKVKLKHREPRYEGKGDNQMDELCLKGWIKDGINEGLGAYNIQDTIEKMFDAGKIKQLLIESLTPEIINAVTPFYKDEFYSNISGDKLVVSPWWDDCWQDIKIVDLVKESIEGRDIDCIMLTRDSFIKSIEIIDKNIKDMNNTY
tara:strand:- start:1781 stop:2218 length:438 start_codon:yes stop_codon:yes gene_type:complete